jgi:predicted nucleotidyltransferase/catechol 2,3-dioxygenase-like lactoylglutathione lyase family enzyme
VTDPAGAIAAMTRRLVAEGATAVVLTGSHARGSARPDSDIDVTAIGEGRAEPSMEVLDGELFSIAWRTVDGEREAMRDPERAGAAVPAWRGVRLLHDPDGIAEALQREARGFRWSEIDSACDAWVAEAVTGYAEEVHKLVGAMRRGDRDGQAIQAAILAVHLGPVMAISERLEYETENDLWRLLDERLGDPWRSIQAVALGLDGEPVERRSSAALALYGLIAERAAPSLDTRQRPVVERSLRLIDDAAVRPSRRSTSGVGFVGIRTSRFDEMVALFRDAIGLEVVHEAQGATWFRLGADGQLHVYADTDPDHAFFTTGPVVGIRVDDLDATRAMLEASGIEFLTEVERTATAAWCHLRAPDGTVLEIIGPGTA